MADSEYVLGHSNRELARLERQAGLYAEATRDGLIKAGLVSGMRVLDLGCGVGDVTFIASDLVTGTGSVTGIDISETAIATSRARAELRPNGAQFEQVAVEVFDRFTKFDAVIGRFILVHFSEPSAILRLVASRVRPGTLMVSMEMDISSALATAPFPLMDQHVSDIVKTYRAIGLSPDMGTRLHSAYRAAGLSPRLAAFTPVGDQNDPAGFDFLAESVRSLLPTMEKLQITTAAEVDVDTLADRLAAEAARTDPAVFYPRFTTAWART